MNQCQNCGQVNNQGSNFCRFCGTKIIAAQNPYTQNPYAQPPMPPPQQPQPQPQSYENNPPKPYSWKTDEFQVTNAKARKTQDFNQAQPLAGYGTPRPLVHQPPPAQMAYSYRCPRCGSQNLPHIERKISPAGWIVFAVLLLVFFPLFWIGFLIKEDVRVCPVCNSRV